MVRFFQSFTYAFFLLSYCVSQAHAGAWVKPRHQGYWALTSNYYQTSDFYDDRGDKQSQDRFHKIEENFYIEWGLTDNITIGSNLFGNYVSQSGKGNLGLSNSEFFLRQKLYDDEKSVLSIQPLVKLASLYQHEIPRGGSSSYDGELALQYGRSLHLLSADDYLDSAAAFRLRSDGLAQQWRLEAKLGLGITDKIRFIPAIYTTRSINAEESSQFTESGDLDYSLTKLEIGLSYALNNTQLNLTVFRHIEGEQTGAGQGISAGFGVPF